MQAHKAHPGLFDQPEYRLLSKQNQKVGLVNELIALGNGLGLRPERLDCYVPAVSRFKLLASWGLRRMT